MAAAEVLVFMGILMVVCLSLVLLARVIWWVGVGVANLKGYAVDEMPRYYHMLGIGTYFCIVFLLAGLFLLT